ncbi:hypothetical protein EDB85DRAFT_2180100 [Lactarius pseudohatsudake]|nr:hypothetical protein EDB85DRAFT_2180100 [Lactarius pseudohatsudake]
MSTLFFPNAGPDMSAPGDHISQCYDQPGLWQFNPTPDTDPSFQQRPHTGIGSHSPGPDISEIIARASKQALDKNIFHARVKWAAGQQQMENAKRNGTRISKEALRHLSWRARMLWISLDRRKLAPPTFGGITAPAWDYYSRTLLNDPKLEFLLLCDDTEWKLRLWSTKAYSCWSGAHGVREKKTTSVKQEPTRPLAGPSDLVNIDDEDLIHMGPDNEVNDPDDIMGEMHNEDVSPDTTHSDNVNSVIVPNNKCAGIRVVILYIRELTRSSTYCGCHRVDAADPLSPADATSGLTLSVPGEREAATSPTRGNLRLERARVGQDGNSKRKNDIKTPAAAALKRQKVSNTPAEPTHTNSIRNICMRQWNEKQPGGQGLTSDFDAHFKSLMDAEKEPFRQEMFSIRGAVHTNTLAIPDSEKGKDSRHEDQ